MNPGPGSYRLLVALARLGVAGIEPLAHMLGISARAVYSHAERLERAGLVWRVPIRDGAAEPWPSRVPARWVRDEELPAVAPRSQVPSTGEHSRAVSWVAAYFELQRGHRWLGPAELRADRDWQLRRDDGAGHLPNLGLVTSNGGRHAIEVGLHSKSPDRLRAILRAYRWKIELEGLTAVHYVTTRSVVARAVEREGRDARLANRLDAVTLDEVIGLVRDQAARHEAGDGGPP